MYKSIHFLVTYVCKLDPGDSQFTPAKKKLDLCTNVMFVEIYFIRWFR